MIGNGSCLSISHQGSAKINTICGPLILNNVLYVPETKRNLFSISQFIDDNPCNFHFPTTDFSIVHRHSGRVIASGTQKGRLNVLDNIKHAAFFSNRQQYASFVWHSTLGHCSSQVVKLLKSQNLITITSVTSHLCTSCNIGKFHRLPFSDSTNR